MRRAPDPDRPGTVYRSRPKLLRFGRFGRAGRSGSMDGSAERSTDSPFDRSVGGAPSTTYPPPPPDQGYPPAPPRQTYPPAPPDRPYSPLQTDRGRRRRRRWPWIVLLLVVLLIAYPIGLGVTAMRNLDRVTALPSSGRTANTPGRTYLVVGSDSRADLTRAERARLGTGQAAGQRTDTIMILHVPASGGPTVLVSVPRDSYVPIPGHGRNKINAAYALGGPKLLVRTVESVTGLHIDDYVETGLGGYANLVDAIGGVRICVKRAMNDPKAHINLRPGCQQMDGTTALGYARARYSDPRGDLGRVERQREVLAAIASKTLSPAVIAAPWRAFPAARAGGAALVVDDGTSPIGIARFVLAMRAVSGGNGVSLTVPVSGDISTSAGDALQWNRTKALALFEAIRTDRTESVRALAAEQNRAA